MTDSFPLNPPAPTFFLFCCTGTNCIRECLYMPLQSLYQKKVHSRACRDAEIFVVSLGTMDVLTECVGMPVAAIRKTAQDEFSEEETCQSVKNIREICETLRAEGKKVTERGEGGGALMFCIS